jgi:RND superfamily putative drug exporter
VNRILYRLGNGAAAHPWRTISAWAVSVVVAFGVAGACGAARHRRR